MALSIALLAGLMLFAASRHPAQVREPLAWLESQLQPMLDRETLAGFKSAFERVASHASASRVAASSPGGEAMQAASSPNWLETRPAPAYVSGSPILWALDDPAAHISSDSADVLSIAGTNISDQALEEVQTVLKPDTTQRELKLALRVEGQPAEAKAIPAGARFSLVSTMADNGDLSPGGGAILTFRYVQAGRGSTSILYLTPEMLSRLTGGG
jgi:hypothetical protein